MRTAAVRGGGKQTRMLIDLGYDPHEAFARHLLTVTVRSGAVNGWARVHGYTVDCPPRQVRAAGVDVHTDVLRRVDLSDVTAAAKTFAANPRGRPPAADEARVSTALAAIHADPSRGSYPSPPDLAARIDQRAAALIFQIAARGQLSHP